MSYASEIDASGQEYFSTASQLEEHSEDAFITYFRRPISTRHVLYPQGEKQKLDGFGSPLDPEVCIQFTRQYGVVIK